MEWLAVGNSLREMGEVLPLDANDWFAVSAPQSSLVQSLQLLAPPLVACLALLGAGVRERGLYLPTPARLASLRGGGWPEAGGQRPKRASRPWHAPCALADAGGCWEGPPLALC